MTKIYRLSSHDTILFNHSKGLCPNVGFHLHDGCEVYFFISGDANYLIEKNIYPMKYGDLFITNEHEVHAPFFNSDCIYERIYIQFDPKVARNLSTTTCDLLNCFYNRPAGHKNKIALDRIQLEEINFLFSKIENACNKNIWGNDIIKMSAFAELLVFINRIFMDMKTDEDNGQMGQKLFPILDFIDCNLDQDLNLEIFEKTFYINKYYLCRIFKKATGMNLHEYIIFKRVARAKKLLMEGKSVTETCHLSGFNDYSNFIRTFKRTVGISPGKYSKIAIGK